MIEPVTDLDVQAGNYFFHVTLREQVHDFAAMNAVYAKRMGDARPARTTVFVAGLPGGAPIEMDLIARARR